VLLWQNTADLPGSILKMATFGSSYGDSSYGSGGSSSYHAGAPATGSSRDSSNECTRLSQVISKNIQTIQQNVAQLQRMVNQIGTQQDSPQLRDKLHQIQHYSNQIAKETSAYLRELSHLPQPPNQSDQRQRKMQKERFMNEFSTALKNFQAAQRQAAEKEKASVKRARASSGFMSDPFFDERKSDDALVESAFFPAASDHHSPSQQQILAMEQDVDLQLMQEREQSIRKLESDIMDVNQIFKDLGMLVHEQGEMIDSIETNVENAQIHVVSGTEQLQKAKEYQSKARRKKCVCLILVIIALAVIGVIIGVSVSQS
jgi:syntaxin 12/13